MTEPISLTPGDDHIPADARTVPDLDEEYSIDFADVAQTEAELVAIEISF